MPCLLIPDVFCLVDGSLCPASVGCGGLVGRGFVFCFFDGEFDPGSGRTLAACLTHASRTLKLQLAGVDEWRTGE